MRHSKIFTGSSHPELTNAIMERLGVKPATVSFRTFSNHETAVEIGESVRNMDVFIIQSGSETVNDHLMELLIMVNACKSASARRITAILPYFPYGKHCKKKRMRGAITAKLVANMLAVAGVNHVITMDLHSSQIQGFFNKPVDNLFAEPSIAKFILDKITDLTNGVVVSKNAGGAKRVTSLADRLKIDFALLHKDTSVIGQADQLRGKGVMAESLVSLPSNSSAQNLPSQNQAGVKASSNGSLALAPSSSAFNIPVNSKNSGQLTLVGDVAGKVVFIVDDIVDSAESFVYAAKYLMGTCKADRVYLVATHGIFSGDSLFELSECNEICGVIVTNTYPISAEKKASCRKLEIIDVSTVFAEAIRRTHNGESISYLFDTVV